MVPRAIQRRTPMILKMVRLVGEKSFICSVCMSLSLKLSNYCRVRVRGTKEILEGEEVFEDNERNGTCTEKRRRSHFNFTTCR